MKPPEYQKDVSTLNILRLGQNGRHFPDDIFSMNWYKVFTEIWISYIPASFQIMSWRRIDDKPLSEPMNVSLLTHICVFRSQWINACCVLTHYPHGDVAWLKTCHFKCFGMIVIMLISSDIPPMHRNIVIVTNKCPSLLINFVYRSPPISHFLA